MTSRIIDAEELQRLLAAKTYLLNHLDERIPSAQLARKFAFRPQKLNDGFRLLFGLPLRRYLQETRLLTAQILLRHSDRPIKAVAALCGYPNYRNFITAYRKYFGRTPNRERRS